MWENKIKDEFIYEYNLFKPYSNTWNDSIWEEWYYILLKKRQCPFAPLLKCTKTLQI